MDGAVVCGKCGAEQAFDVKGWHDAFDLAHSTADYGPGNQGWGKATVDTGNMFTILTVAGHPLCETCHGLLGFTVGDAHKVDVSCGACKTAVSYITPERAVKMTHGALRAVISPEHRADHNEVKVVETGAAVAVHCPQCEAPLDASAGTKFVHCKYCNTTSRIPDDIWFRVNGNEPKPIPIWLAFSGMSPERRLEIKKKTDAERAAARDRQISAEKQARALKHAQEESAREEKIAHQKQLDEESAAKDKAIKEAKEKKQAILVVFGIVVVSIIVAVIVVLTIATPSSEANATPAPTHGTQATTRSTPPSTHSTPATTRSTPPSTHSTPPSTHSTPAHR